MLLQSLQVGGVTYIKNLLAGLSKTETNHQFIVLTTAAGKEKFYFQHPRFTFLSFKIPSLSPLLRLCWEQTFLVLSLRRLKIDVLFSPANVAPLFSGIPNVVMIQNIEPFGNNVSVGRGLLSGLRLKLLKWLTVLSINKSQGVIFPSTKACRVVGESGFSQEINKKWQDYPCILFLEKCASKGFNFAEYRLRHSRANHLPAR